MESSISTVVRDLKIKEELVYAVEVNLVEECIIVIFRGLVTKNDFMTDVRIAVVKAPDPGWFNETGGDNSNCGNVGVHQGFYVYLFGESDGASRKYVEILQHLVNYLQKNRDVGITSCVSRVTVRVARLPHCFGFTWQPPCRLLVPSPS